LAPPAIPINVFGYFEEDGPLRLQDIYIELAEAQIRNGRMCHSSEGILLTIVWIYLLAEGRKLDFGPFLTEFQNAQDWSKVQLCGSPLEPQALVALEAWKISVFFTPMELWQLINELPP
jgi:hypothetical protein